MTNDALGSPSSTSADAARPLLNVGLLGSKFMGRAHSGAWTSVSRMFDVPIVPVLHTIGARDAGATRDFAAQWGWQHSTTDAAALVRDPAIDLVDIGTPNDVHRDAAIGALEAGKHVACEKPLAATLDDARAMTAAAQGAAGRTFVWFSYRRVPAIALAHRVAASGRLGAVRHVRAVYAQQWGQGAGEVWRFDAARAGSGALGDIAAHIVDTVQFVTGEQVTTVDGAATRTFVPEHTVDDGVAFLATLSGGGLATFEATRFATGFENRHGFEIHGENGALRFWFDSPAELQWYDASADKALRGWTTVLVGDPAAGHPWAQGWWPAGHPTGYGDTFTNMAYDILLTLSGAEPTVAIPDFTDALQVQTVLEAVVEAAARKAPVEVAEVAAS